MRYKRINYPRDTFSELRKTFLSNSYSDRSVTVIFKKACIKQRKSQINYR